MFQWRFIPVKEEVEGAGRMCTCDKGVGIL